MLAFALLSSAVWAQAESERAMDALERTLERSRYPALCVNPGRYMGCDSECRGEYERCLRQAANVDDNQCRGEYEACERICETAYCEE